MIESHKGDILSADVEALVNTVNCVGVMGRGIALQFKNAFPENYEAYAAACERSEVQPGRMFIYVTGELTNPKYIINFPTKRHWRGKSRIADIETGLMALRDDVRRLGISSIAIPPLGSGLGGLDWSEVRPRIVEAFKSLPTVKVELFEPHGANEPKVIAKSRDVPAMTEGRAALIILIHQYLAGLLDPMVTLVEVHKLLYFMQAAGQRLRLRYSKGPYGPYAENLTHVLRTVEGHFISGYADGGDVPSKELALVPGALEDAERFLADRAEIAQRFIQVAQLVEGFESPFGLELLATVHWLVHEAPEATLKQITQSVHSWNLRKRQFTERQIRIAWQRLRDLGWLKPQQEN
jgi:O-acetyl-ADP-ribose deacetylase (regulator of RNase III)